MAVNSNSYSKWVFTFFAGFFKHSEDYKHGNCVSIIITAHFDAGGSHSRSAPPNIHEVDKITTMRTEVNE